MKLLQALLAAVWGVGLLLSAGHSRRAPKSLFVFGDSFADTGNLPRTDRGYVMSRQWYHPYGISSAEATATQAKPNGRFSDFLVQSDFVARMLGLPQAPPTYQSMYHAGYCSPAGINYAFGTTGVFEISNWINLREQVDAFKYMVKKGIISQDQVTGSVALIAISGNDYKHFLRKNPRDNEEFIGNVTSEIASIVERLQKLGVSKILVNNLHPLGCSPALTRAHQYESCSDASNDDASSHNANLVQKLGNKTDVFIVDLHSAFRNVIGDPDEESESSYHKFKENRKPCCEAVSPDGYCGQQGDKSSEPLYSLCQDPTTHFFWDEDHPTHAAWEAVMKQVQDPIYDFLGLVYSE